MLQSLSFLILWISSRGIVGSNLSILCPTRFLSIPETDFVTAGWAASELWVEGVVDLEAAGMNGAAVMLAQVTAGALPADAFVPLDETLDSEGKVACIVCNGFGTGRAAEGANFVVRKRFSNLVDRNFDLTEARSPSKGMLSSRVTWS
jgi:hypothetical protein